MKIRWLVLLTALLLPIGAMAVPADINGDEEVTLADLVSLLRFTFEQELPLVEGRMDVDGSGIVDLRDSLYLLRYLCGEDVPLYEQVTPTPTVLPTPTATWTDIPTETPTEEPITAVTPTPTAMPTETPTPTPTLTPTATPTIAPTPTPEPALVTFENALTVSADVAYVDFGDVVVQNWADVAPFLRQLPNLRRCDMYASVIEHKDIEALAAEFPQVEFGWSMLVARCNSNNHGDSDHIVRTDAEAYSTLHWAYDISPQHTSDDFSVLRFCKNMKALDIGHNRVSDLSFLSSMTELRILIVAITYDVTDISPLANLTHLQYLELFTNSISDLSPLSNLYELLDLNICFNIVRDYTPLYGLKQLERLWIYNSYAYARGIAVPWQIENELHKALPNTLINNTATDPTGGWWRTHERTVKVRNIFNTSVYEPLQ